MRFLIVSIDCYTTYLHLQPSPLVNISNELSHVGSIWIRMLPQLAGHHGWGSHDKANVNSAANQSRFVQLVDALEHIRIRLPSKNQTEEQVSACLSTDREVVTSWSWLEARLLHSIVIARSLGYGERGSLNTDLERTYPYSSRVSGSEV